MNYSELLEAVRDGRFTLTPGETLRLIHVGARKAGKQTMIDQLNAYQFVMAGVDDRPPAAVPVHEIVAGLRQIIQETE